MRIFRIVSSRQVRFMAAGALLIALCSMGCSSHVNAVGNREVIDLSADDTANLMLRAGFTPKQILKFGEDLRNALAIYGAAELKIHGDTEALFAVHHPYVHVSSRKRGSFIYEKEKGVQTLDALREHDKRDTQ